MKERLLAALLTLALVCALVPTAALAAGGDFVIEDGVLTKYNGPGGAVVIPDEVTGISDCAFMDRTDVTSVAIPAGVISIGQYAFAGCTALSDVTIQNSGDIQIGRDAFRDTPWLKSLGEFAVVNGILLKYQSSGGNVTIPNTVTRIGDEAFYNCTGLTGVTIPNTVTNIGNSAFLGCTGLTEVIIPVGVFNIEAGAFYRCTSLARVTIPYTVIGIGDNAFSCCGKLTAVALPGSVRYIGKEAFRDCTSLAYMDIPDSVTFLGSWVFTGCTSLTRVRVPANVTNLNRDMFQNCSSLTEITIAQDNQRYASVDGVLFTKAMDTLVMYPQDKQESDYTIPDSVTTIGSGAFKNCVGLTSVTLPESVSDLNIKAEAFQGCTELARVAFENRMSRLAVEADAFQGCEKLTIYGVTGTMVEQYCLENNIPFELLTTPLPGTARQGTMESGSGESVSWDITAQGEINITFPDTVQAEEAILVACYDTSGRFTGVKWVTAQSPATQIDPATPNVRLFWLGAEGTPQSSSVTVWGK